MENTLIHRSIYVRIRNYADNHRIASIILVAAFFGVGYWAYGTIRGGSTVIHYVLSAAEKGTLIVSVTGSGQVSSSLQVDVKAKVSGDAIYIGVGDGEEVAAGTLITQLDARNAQKTVRDAEASLESAHIALEKLRGPDSLLVPRNKQQAADDLAKAYDDGFNAVANTFLDLPSVMSGLRDMLFGIDRTLGGGNQANIDYYTSSITQYDTLVVSAKKFRDDTYNKYQIARASYDQTFSDYKSVSRFSDSTAIEKIVNEAYSTTKNVAEAVKSGNDLIQFYVDKLIERDVKPQALAATHLASLNNYTGTTNSHLGSLLNTHDVIKSSKDAILNADLDLRSQNLSVKQKENALLDARENLSDYYIRAPFAGTIAKVNIKKSDSVGNGAAVATLITNKKLAEISFNEIDVAKIKIGQKATLTFDAVSGLSIAGEVSEIDTIGTVSQGVVTYNVKVGFDTQDERVKTGMSVAAAIVTDIKQDVLMVPNSAVKTRGEAYYAQVVGKDILAEQSSLSGVAKSQGVVLVLPSEERLVEVGLSNGSNTEIISGLSEGDPVIVRTVAPTTQASTQSVPSLFGAPGRGAGGGGVLRGVGGGR